MLYRTRTYIAGDWSEDQDLIAQLYKWNQSNYWSLHFSDSHELKQARDTSLSCSIKRSLKERLDASKTFILIVGKKTDVLTKGSCQYCQNYSAYFSKCSHSMTVDYRSFIQYECEKAYRDHLKIIVLYNFSNVNKSKCPEILRNTGIHVPAFYLVGNRKYWNYYTIKDAIEN